MPQIQLRFVALLPKKGSQKLARTEPAWGVDLGIETPLIFTSQYLETTVETVKANGDSRDSPVYSRHLTSLATHRHFWVQKVYQCLSQATFHRQMETEISGDRSKILEYMMKYRLKNLIEHLGEFSRNPEIAYTPASPIDPLNKGLIRL